MRLFETFGYPSPANPMGKAAGSHLDILILTIVFVAFKAKFVDSLLRDVDPGVSFMQIVWCLIW
jgi:ABC-type methionine transport system permease subunit